MRILFQNRDRESWIGGDMIQLDMTRKYLEQLGFKTRFSAKMIADAEDIVDVDWVHCFNFSMPWTKYQIWNAKKLRKKVACSMIYHETDDFVEYSHQQAMINELDACIFLTEGERDRALRHLTIPPSKIYIIPNGIESWWFDKSKEIFSSDVLTIGRLDANKGQLTTAQACNRLGLNYVCIGENSRYGQIVEKEGVKIIAPLSQHDLVPYYQGCKVYAQISYKEVMPLTVMEAGAQAKNIVLTKGCEWEIPCDRAAYNNVDEICVALEKSLLKSPNFALRDQLKEMTWAKVVNQLKTIYEANY